MATDLLDQTLEALRTAAERKRYRQIDFFVPYVKQQEFFDAGATFRERLLMAGNQNGKSHAGGVEASYHLTGEYPPDWMGRRFNHPVRCWITGETGVVVRDVQQKKLCGTPGVEADFGTGLIPRERFIEKPSLSRGVTDAFDTMQVEHRTNGVVDGVSTGIFKSYEQGRTKFQGDSIDFIWFDEEPPPDIYSEGLTRTVATGGMSFMTFTPLKGMSEVVMLFMDGSLPEDRKMVVMTIDDALHIPKEERAKIIASWPAHEREARARGIPMLGSGRIFTTPEEMITEPDLAYIPPYWSKIWGIDFGIGHPFAAVVLVWDKDNDVIHIVNGFRMQDGLPLNHAYRMKMIGGMLPVAWPQDGTARDKGSGEALKDLYKKQGLQMLPDHATWPDGSNSTEAGILEMQERMETGRFKVAASLSDWFEEYRMYHRKDGAIVKLRDDLLSATRIAIMDKRHSRLAALGGSFNPNKRKPIIAKGVDFDPF